MRAVLFACLMFAVGCHQIFEYVSSGNIDVYLDGKVLTQQDYDLDGPKFYVLEGAQERLLLNLNDEPRILEAVRTGETLNKWSARYLFAADIRDDPTIDQSGQILVFGRSVPDEESNLWYALRTDTGFTEPRLLFKVNTAYKEYAPELWWNSTTEEFELFFSSDRHDAHDTYNVYQAACSLK